MGLCGEHLLGSASPILGMALLRIRAHGVSTVIPIAKRRMLRHREAKQLAPDHTACKRRGWD